MLGLAARVWQSASFARAASQAILKLEASGADVDADALALVEPRFAAAEASFGRLYEAVRDGRPVTFGYRTPGAQRLRPAQRWSRGGIVSWHGHWYVVGHDTDRDATRVFRLSRVDGEARFTGPPGSVAVPEDVERPRRGPRCSPRSRRPARGGAGPVGSRAAVAPPRRQPPPPGEAGWDVLEVGYGDDESLAEEIVGFGADVVAVAPAGAARRSGAPAERGAGRNGGEPHDRRDRRRRGGSVAQLSRLLALIPWLLARPGVSVDEAAAEFGVTPKQLERDLELAFMCGLPGHLPTTSSRSTSRVAGSTSATPTRSPGRCGWASDEAVALLVGLRALADVPGCTTGPSWRPRW